MSVINPKPINTMVNNPKPVNSGVINIKPKNQAFGGQNFTYLENKTINVGSPMGLLLAITYPTTVTFLGPRI